MEATRLPDAASTERLTATLRRAGILDRGKVVSVEVLASWPKARNNTSRLRLRYAGAPPDTPATLILKAGLRVDGGPPWTAGGEPAFYRDVAPLLEPGLVPLCFGSADASASEPGWLLLEDLTDTHARASEHPLPPPDALCSRIIGRWGRLHAGLWDDPRLPDLCGSTAAAIRAGFLGRCARAYPSFVDRHGDIMPIGRRRLCERIIEAGPRFVARLGAVPLTLVHGDAHWWNCLVPRDGGGDVRLIDWEDLTSGPATTDLAYMMAMLWFPDRRRALEGSLLDAYHEELTRAGVTAFTRRVLAEDYRWSVALQMLRPIGQAMAGLPARVWWPNLERNFLAFDDLGCEGLLG